MKKLLTIAMVITMLITLGACGSTTTTVCTGTNEYEDIIVETMISKKDVMKKHTTVYTSTYAYELSENIFTAEEIIDEYEYRKSLYSDIKGAEYKYEFDEEKGEVVESIFLNYDEMTIEEIRENGFVDDKKADYISLEMSVDYFKNEMGYVCETQK